MDFDKEFDDEFDETFDNVAVEFDDEFDETFDDFEEEKQTESEVPLVGSIPKIQAVSVDEEEFNNSIYDSFRKWCKQVLQTNDYQIAYQDFRQTVFESKNEMIRDWIRVIHGIWLTDENVLDIDWKKISWAKNFPGKVSYEFLAKHDNERDAIIDILNGEDGYALFEKFPMFWDVLVEACKYEKDIKYVAAIILQSDATFQTQAFKEYVESLAVGTMVDVRFKDGKIVRYVKEGVILANIEDSVQTAEEVKQETVSAEDSGQDIPEVEPISEQTIPEVEPISEQTIPEVEPVKEATEEPIEAPVEKSAEESVEDFNRDEILLKIFKMLSPVVSAEIIKQYQASGEHEKETFMSQLKGYESELYNLSNLSDGVREKVSSARSAMIDLLNSLEPDAMFPRDKEIKKILAFLRQKDSIMNSFKEADRESREGFIAQLKEKEKELYDVTGLSQNVREYLGYARDEMISLIDELKYFLDASFYDKEKSDTEPVIAGTQPVPNSATGFGQSTASSQTASQSVAQPTFKQTQSLQSGEAIHITWKGKCISINPATFYDKMDLITEKLGKQFLEDPEVIKILNDAGLYWF